MAPYLLFQLVPPQRKQNPGCGPGSRGRKGITIGQVKFSCPAQLFWALVWAPFIGVSQKFTAKALMANFQKFFSLERIHRPLSFLLLFGWFRFRVLFGKFPASFSMYLFPIHSQKHDSSKSSSYIEGLWTVGWVLRPGYSMGRICPREDSHLFWDLCITSHVFSNMTS